MDRISPSSVGQRTLHAIGQSIGNPLGQAKQVGPRAIDPSQRLRLVDSQDTVMLGGAGTSARAPSPNTATLVASVVEPAPTPPTASTAQPVSTRAADALKMYRAPGEQNVAATRAAAGSLLDVQA